MAPPVTRPRSNAISGSRDFLALSLNDKELKMLLAARDTGIQRGVALLSRMDMDIESIVWSGAQSAGSLAATYATDPIIKPAEAAKIDVLQSGLEGLKDFVQWLYDKVKKKLEANEWIQRLGKLLGIGLEVGLAFVKKYLFSMELLKSLLPGYLPVKHLLAAGRKACATWSDRNALRSIETAAPYIGSGVPHVMFEQFSAYLSREIQLNSLKTGYTFAKSLATVLLTILAAPVASALAFVTDVVDAVCAFVYKIYQGYAFSAATQKCRDWVKNGSVAAELDFGDTIASCPFIGCLFFGAANYIGHFNLTAMLTRPTFMSSANLMQAVSEVSSVQQVACRYVKDTQVPFKFTQASDQWIGEMMIGMADETPRSEFVTDDASLGARWRHFRKVRLQPAAVEVGSLLLRGME